MHQTLPESVAYIDALAKVQPPDDLQLFVILPFTSLAGIVATAHRADIWVGAQNMHWADTGEYTGEISASMLRAIGVDLVLLGHAERRIIFHEDDATIGRKVRTALAHGLRVILCVGETAEERRSGAGAQSIVRQLKIGLHGVSQGADVIIAYEPVWAIGEAGTAPDAGTIAEAAAAIRDVTGSLPLVYGGSVSEGSAPDYAKVSGIDGLFVGRAARTAEGFARTLAAAFPNALLEGKNSMLEGKNSMLESETLTMEGETLTLEGETLTMEGETTYE